MFREENGPPREWAHAQLRDARVPQPIAAAVKRLLETWWIQNHSKQTRDMTLDAFDKLARGHALVVEDPDERWQLARPGQITVRDEIRVKADAYDNEAGAAHNGRKGVVVAIRYGDVIVDYRDGKHPEMKGVHHPPQSLEKRV